MFVFIANAWRIIILSIIAQSVNSDDETTTTVPEPVEILCRKFLFSPASCRDYWEEIKQQIANESEKMPPNFLIGTNVTYYIPRFTTSTNYHPLYIGLSIAGLILKLLLWLCCCCAKSSIKERERSQQCEIVDTQPDIPKLDVKYSSAVPTTSV